MYEQGASYQDDDPSLPGPHTLLNPQSYEVITDPELADLLRQGMDAMGIDALDRALQANDRFDGPVTVVNDDRSERYEEHYSHKQLLADIPPAVDVATAAGMSADTLSDVIAHTLGAIRYAHSTQSRFVVANLTHALESSARGGEPLTEAQLATFKTLISKAGEDDVIEMSLNAYSYGRRAGLSFEDSVRLVDDHINTANYRQLGYKMYKFRDALRSLDGVEVEPEVVVAIFDKIRDMHPEYRGDVYEEVAYAITFGAAAAQKTPGAMLGDIAARLERGDERAVAELLGDQAESSAVVFAPREQRDKYFPSKHGRLENRATPYRLLRSFGEGMEDLTGLTEAQSARGELVSEGHWVYDPQSSTWYSHGGETRFVGIDRIRHTSISYDISELSQTPYSVHLHVSEYAIGASKYGFVFPTNADYRAVAFMLENAHGPAQPRSFISHPLGITEFVYPNDPAALRRVAEGFEAIRDQYFSHYGDADGILRSARLWGAAQFARSSVMAVNTQLPTGFGLRFYPRGTDFGYIEQTGR